MDASIPGHHGEEDPEKSNLDPIETEPTLVLMKAPAPISSSESGREILEREAQLYKASRPILSSVDGNWTELRLEKAEKGSPTISKARIPSPRTSFEICQYDPKQSPDVTP
jgi:hypothetical protein